MQLPSSQPCQPDLLIIGTRSLYDSVYLPRHAIQVVTTYLEAMRGKHGRDRGWKERVGTNSLPVQPSFSVVSGLPRTPMGPKPPSVLTACNVPFLLEALCSWTAWDKKVVTTLRMDRGSCPIGSRGNNCICFITSSIELTPGGSRAYLAGKHTRQPLSSWDQYLHRRLPFCRSLLTLCQLLPRILQRWIRRGLMISSSLWLYGEYKVCMCSAANLESLGKMAYPLGLDQAFLLWRHLSIGYQAAWGKI